MAEQAVSSKPSGQEGEQIAIYMYIRTLINQRKLSASNFTLKGELNLLGGAAWSSRTTDTLYRTMVVIISYFSIYEY